jgi:hypothetical protein
MPTLKMSNTLIANSAPPVRVGGDSRVHADQKYWMGHGSAPLGITPLNTLPNATRIDK